MVIFPRHQLWRCPWRNIQAGHDIKRKKGPVPWLYWPSLTIPSILAQSVTMHSNSHPFNDFVEPTKVCAEGWRPCREVQLWSITDEDAQLHFVCQLHCVHPWGLNAFYFIQTNNEDCEVPAWIATWMHSCPEVLNHAPFRESENSEVATKWR